MKKGKQKGNQKVKVIVLSIIMALALVPWLFILTRNLSDNETPEPTPDVNVDESLPILQVPASSPTPEPERTPIPIPEPPPRRTPEPEPEPTPEPVERVIEIASEHTEVADAINTVSKSFNCAAVSMVVYDGDKKEFYTYEYGFADIAARRSVNAETKFRVASLSKLVTVICAMILVDEQRLDIDLDISYYLGYDVRNPYYPDIPITTRMLMQHTSSIFDSEDFRYSRQRTSVRPAKALLDAGTSYRQAEPGAEYEYSNFGYSLLAGLCEVIYGKKFDLLSREILFEPMGIDAAYVASRLEDKTNIAAIYNDRHSLSRSVQSILNVRDTEDLGRDVHLTHGSLVISILDYARILAMLGNDGVYEGVKLLSAESIDEINYTNVRGEEFEMGLGTRRSALEFMPRGEAFWHTGSAYGTFTQYVYSVNNTNTGVVVITTGAKTDRLPSGMVRVCTELAEAVWQLVK